MMSVADLHASLRDPALESMTFLNEISLRYPEAVSFAAGRPTEDLFDLEAVHRYLRRYEQHLATEKGMSPEQVRRTMLQYGRTKGIIHELIARNLLLDEAIRVDPESIVVTVGAQEAMVLALRALRTDERDVVLAVSPTYVGLTGAARLLDLPVLPVRPAPTGSGDDGAGLVAELERTVRRARAAGQRPRGCYLVPDFSNPSGVSLDLATRRALLELAASLDLLLLEDNPYGLFSLTDDRMPTLKSLDTRQRVIYLGTFAKTGIPGARVGFVVADQLLDDGGDATVLLADQLAKIKSMLTVNTSPIAQAVVGGRLLEHNCSLVAANQAEIAVYRRNLARMRAGLERRFPAGGAVTWNVPAGGFFLVLTVGFSVDDACLEHSAREYGVLWTPMSHFDDGPQARQQLRLSFSAVGPEQIDEGLDRLAALVNGLTDTGVQEAGRPWALR
jgi:(S)-3,5-dihydroxyphenylglycine transaminase